MEDWTVPGQIDDEAAAAFGTEVRSAVSLGLGFRVQGLGDRGEVCCLGSFGFVE